MIEALSWAVGDELEGHTLPPVIRMRLITYAGASGDFNPIHLVDEAAKEAGLPGIIAHDMLTVATMGLLFFPYLEHGYVKGFRSRFLGMVSLGDVLRVGGRVSGVKEIGQGRLYAFDVYALRGGMIRSHRGRSSSWSTEVSFGEERLPKRVQEVWTGIS